ncbi:MAG: hypothetical protein ACM30G_20370 [Micromonosporaceae bacterium]
MPRGQPENTCGATTRAGHPCGQAAGHGTPHRGQGKCAHHGGSTPTHIRAAQNVLARQTANAYGIPRHIDPADGLIEEYWRTAGIVAGLEAKVRSIPEDELIWGVTETTVFPESEDGNRGGRVTKSKAVPNIWLKLFNEERDRFAKLGVEIVRLGLEARRDQYIRAQVDTFAAIVFHPALALTEAQRTTAAQLLRDLDARQQLIEGVVER